MRLEAADKLATFLGIRVTLPSEAESKPIVLKAKDYINAVIDEWNLAHRDASIPHTGASFVTLHKFCDGEKIQALFKRRGGPEMQVGVVLDSGNAERNREAAEPYRMRLAAQLESGRIEDVPTAGNNVGFLRRIPIESDTDVAEMARVVVQGAMEIRSLVSEDRPWAKAMRSANDN